MNKIEAAVAPLKDLAMDRAEQVARERIEAIRVELEAAGWDRQKAAPYPRSFNNSREAYRKGQAKYYQFRAVTKSTDDRISRGLGDADPCEMWAEGCAKLIQDFRDSAAEQYEAYVAKLNLKIGEVVDAELEGKYVWNLSFLKVTKADGTKETWKTQTIINVSVLGKLFNQWPTRKVKA